jgi:hypothetical protein
VRRSIRGLACSGTGAERQRSAAENGLQGVVNVVVRQTAGTEPQGDEKVGRPVPCAELGGWEDGDRDYG